MTIWRLRITYSMPKARDAHSEYVAHIAFPLQQWLHEPALTLRLLVHWPVLFHKYSHFPAVCLLAHKRIRMIAML